MTRSNRRLKCHDWKNSVVGPNVCLREALNVIEESGYQIAIVADSKGILKGIVTDSDIRKGLLRGICLSDKITLVMNTEPTVVNAEFDIYNANALMKLTIFFTYQLLTTRKNNWSPCCRQPSKDRR